MSRFFTAFVALFCCCLLSFGQTVAEGVTTRFVDGRYITTASYVVNASYKRASSVLDEVFLGAQRNPTKRLSWLWKNLGQHDNVKGDVCISEHGMHYDPISTRYFMKLGVSTKRDAEPTIYDVAGRLFCQSSDAYKAVFLTITKKFKVMNDAAFSFKVTPLPKGKSLITVDSGICFSRLVTMLLPESRYRSLVEWRIQGLAMNIKKRAEWDTSPNY